MKTFARVAFFAYLLFVLLAGGVALMDRPEPPGGHDGIVVPGFLGTIASFLAGLPWSLVVFGSRSAERNLLAICWMGAFANLSLLGVWAGGSSLLGPLRSLGALLHQRTPPAVQGDVVASRGGPDDRARSRELSIGLLVAAAWLLAGWFTAPGWQSEQFFVRFLSAVVGSPFVLTSLVLPPYVALPAGVALTFWISLRAVRRVRAARSERTEA